MSGRVTRALLARLAARRPLRPESFDTLVAAAVALGAGEPLTQLPPASVVLVLAPHPDDETLGCGGTVARLAAAGATVHVLLATRGEGDPHAGLSPQELGARRSVEAQSAVEVLGVSTRIEQLSLPDGALSTAGTELAAAVWAAVERVQPDVVFAPWGGDGHPDHATLGRVPLPDDTVLWAYEVWTPLPRPNRVIDITAVMDTKRRALACHQTAALSFDPDALLGLARFRSARGQAGHGYAEAFLAGTAREHRLLWAASAT